MKTAKDKYVVLGSDLAGYPLKCAVAEHLIKEGYKITDLGVTDPNYEDPEMMFQRVGFRVGSKISEGEFEKGLLFCGTGMGMSVIANRFQGIRASVVESVFAARMCRAINDANVLCLGAMIWGDWMACEAVDVFLSTKLGDGLENLKEFLEQAAKKVEAIEGN